MNAPAAPPAHWRVLLIADRTLPDPAVAGALAECGITCQLDRIDSLRDALTRLRGGELGERPDLILIQLELANGRGYELLEQIKQTAGLEAVPVVAVARSDVLPDRARAARAGAAGFVTQDALAAELPRLVGTLLTLLHAEPGLERRRAAPPATAAPDQPRAPAQLPSHRRYLEAVQQVIREDAERTVMARVDPRVMFWLCVSAIVGITPFVISSLVRGDLFMMLTVGPLELLLLTVVWEFWRTKRTPVRGLIASTLIGGLVVFLAGTHLQMAGTLWAYPFIGFVYYFLGHRIAGGIVALFWPAVVINAYTWASPDVFARLVVTLALIWLFCVVFAINNERQHAELRRLASSDPLTGVGNRREMYLELGRATQQFERHRIPSSLVVLDVDHFKRINDGHGHAVGDAVLVDLVNVLRNRLRDTDRLFRIGGEEFVVLLPLTPAEEALKVAEALRQQVEHSNLGGVSEVTISSGVAVLRRDEDVAGWLKRADAALYRAKAAGRNRVEAA